MSNPGQQEALELPKSPAAAPAPQVVWNPADPRSQHLLAEFKELEVRIEAISVGFTFTTEQARHEQELFWSRFNAFATLHAGIFVFASVKISDVASVVLQGVGLLLGLLWLTVMMRSRDYVQTSKHRAKEVENAVGLRDPHAPSVIRRHSTDYGVMTAGIVTLAWVGAIIVSVWPA
jgi:hypothetical protein